MKISKEFKIGFFVVVTIALFIWGLNFLKGKNVFKKAKFYYVKYDEIKGLKDANTVYHRGFRIGQVSNISILNDSARSILVEFFIEEKLDIPVNSKALVISNGYMGVMAIDLQLSNENTYYNHGDTLEGYAKPGILDQLEPTKNKIDSILTSLEYMFDRNTQNSIKGTLENIEGFSESLNDNSNRLTKIMRNIESITNNVNNYNDEIQMLLANLSSVSDSLAQAEIKQTFEQTNAAMKQTYAIVEKINNGEGSIGMLINNDTLYHNLEDATKSLDNLLIDLQEHPKRYVHFSIFGGKEKDK